VEKRHESSRQFARHQVVKSVRDQVSAEEWQARVNLAAAYRLTALYGYTEMIATTSLAARPARTTSS